MAGEVMVGWEGVGVSLSCYTGEALGSTLILDEDALDWTGEEREQDGWFAQISYLFSNHRKEIGFNYGESEIDETSFELDTRLWTLEPLQSTIFVGHASFQSSKSGPWMPIREWFDGGEPDSEVFGVGEFFSW